MSTCAVYVMAHLVDSRFVGPCKVGISKTPYARLAMLQTGNPQEIHLVFFFSARDETQARSFEATFHLAFSECRLVGEWFDIRPSLAIAELARCIVSDEVEAKRIATSGARAALGRYLVRRSEQVVGGEQGL